MATPGLGYRYEMMEMLVIPYYNDGNAGDTIFF